jgi:hypothetical protein
LHNILTRLTTILVASEGFNKDLGNLEEASKVSISRISAIMSIKEG